MILGCGEGGNFSMSPKPMIMLRWGLCGTHCGKLNEECNKIIHFYKPPTLSTYGGLWSLFRAAYRPRLGTCGWRPRMLVRGSRNLAGLAPGLESNGGVAATCRDQYHSQ